MGRLDIKMVRHQTICISFDGYEVGVLEAYTDTLRLLVCVSPGIAQWKEVEEDQKVLAARDLRSLCSIAA